MKNDSLLKIWLACLVLIATPQAVRAQNYLDLAGLSPYTHYLTFDTEHFHFTYQKGYLDFTKRAAVHLEHAHEVLSPILKWKPRGRTDILIADNQDDANGFTSPALRIGIVLIATPPDAWFSTAYSDDWIKLLVFHEYTHFLNMDATTEWMEALRIFFGDVIRPNGLWPVWMLEGLAVYFETHTTKLGRGRSPYYDSIVRAYLDEGRFLDTSDRPLTLDRVNGDYPYFPGGEVPYLFGYHLWNQFSKDHALHEDTDAAMGELSLRSSARVPYFIEGNLENVMHKNWSDYWDSFVQESQARLGTQILSIRKLGETPHELLTHSQYASLLGAISADGEWLAYSQSSLQDRSRLILKNLKTAEERRLDDKMLGLGMDFTADSRFLIYSSVRRYHTYQLYSDLLVYDLKSGRTQQITEGLRAKDPSLSPDGNHITFLVSEGATHHLKVADVAITNDRFNITHIRDAFKSPQFAILGTPRFTNNEQIVFSLQEIGKPSSSIMVSSITRNHSHALLANGSMNRFPRAFGDQIYFTSDKTGIDNIYSFPLAGGAVKQLTNVVTAANYPAIAPSGELWASLLTSDGFEIAKLDTSKSNFGRSQPVANPAIPESMPTAPGSLEAALKEPTLQLADQASRDYTPWRSLAPRQWAPVSYLTYGSNAGVSVGGILLGFDTTGKHQYFGLAGYNFKSKTVDGTFNYTYSGFRPTLDFLATTLTTDIASDIAKTQYRKSSQLALSLSYPIRWTYSSLTPKLYAFSSWNKIYDLSSNQGVSSSDFEYARPLIPGVGASLKFSDAQTSRLSFMPEEGNEISLAAEDRINPERFSVIKYLASYTHYFDLGQHFVLMPRAKFLGSTLPTGVDRSFARIEGRDGQNAFDRGGTLNLNRMGIRGYTDRILFARQVAVGSMDFHFPLKTLFSGFGTSPLFLKQFHGFVFAETAFIPSSKLHNFYLPSYGAGFSLDTTLLIRVPVRFNLELQNGTRKDYGGDSVVFFSVEGGSLF